jgi:hypothetical protein
VRPDRAPTASACEPYRELIVEARAPRPERDGDLARPRRPARLRRHATPACARFVGRLRGARRRSPPASSRPRPARRRRSTTAKGRWCAIRRREVPPHAALRADARLLTQIGAAAHVASSTSVWAALHEQAFRRLGGAPRVDRARQSARGRAHARRLRAARSIRSTATCSRTTASSRCRAACAIPIARARSSRASGTRSARRSRAALRDARGGAGLSRSWEERWADTRIHGTTKRQVSAMFAEERPHLQRCRSSPFATTATATRTVHLDGCVEVEAAYYSVPPGWIGQRRRVQWDRALHVRVLDPDRRAAARTSAHEARAASRRRRGSPRAHAATTLALLDVARTRRPSIGTPCAITSIAARGAAPRRILGVLALARSTARRSPKTPRKVALEAGAPSYRFLRRYLERVKLPAPLTLKQVDPLIRQLTALPRPSSNSEETLMNLVELDHAPQTPPLRHGGRPRDAPRQAQARSCRRSTHLGARQRRAATPQDRLIERRAQQARFRDPTARSTLSISTSTRR